MNNKWEDFALIAFHAMKGVLPFWKNANSHQQRAMTRLLYDQVFCAGEPNKTGYISAAAMSAKRRPLVLHTRRRSARSIELRKQPRPVLRVLGAHLNLNRREVVQNLRHRRCPRRLIP